MPEHEVRWKLPTKAGWPVGRRDMFFRVRGDDEVLGTLLISLGGLAWRPKFGRRGHELHMSWEVFDDVMANSGRAKWRPVKDEEED